VYPARELQTYDTATMRFGYRDEKQAISPQFLSDIQSAGFRVVRAGTRAAPTSGCQCGYVEVRKHNPRESGESR
jgi:hypothetical protein